jgi:hypothetical protein
LRGVGGGRVHLKVSDPVRALAALPVSLLLLMAQAHARTLTIPLQYYNVNSGSLGITIGINGGAPQPYLFDTGSNLFNVLYNPATWGGGGPTAPNSTVPRGQNQFYCYGSQPCYQGNIVQMPTLSFYSAGAAAGATPSVTLSATRCEGTVARLPPRDHTAASPSLPLSGVGRGASGATGV